MDLKYKILLVLSIGLLGYAFGRYVQPARVEIKTETVVKEVETENKNVKTQTHEVVNKDGSKEIDTITEDKSEVSDNKDTDTKTDKITIYEKAQWKISALLAPDTSGVLGPLYGASIERRIVGPVFAGVWANTDKKYGISLSLEF